MKVYQVKFVTSIKGAIVQASNVTKGDIAGMPAKLQLYIWKIG